MSSFADEALLDAVDDRELGGALLRLAEEDVRLLEEPGVLEGDAHARGDGRDESLVGLGEGMFARVEKTTEPMGSLPDMIGTPSHEAPIVPMTSSA